jgi:hypothetical protein
MTIGPLWASYPFIVASAITNGGAVSWIAVAMMPVVFIGIVPILLIVCRRMQGGGANPTPWHPSSDFV